MLNVKYKKQFTWHFVFSVVSLDNVHREESHAYRRTKEVKRDEYRVAMLPVGVEELTAAGQPC